MPETQKAELSFRPEDFAKDIAALQAEKGITPTAVEAPKTATVEPTTIVPVSTPTTVEATATPAITAQESTPTPQVEVPEKFKAPDGSLDTSKLEKSTVNAEQALAKYLEKEKELKRKMNEVRQAENSYLNPANAPTPAPSQAPANLPFHQQLEQDAQTIGLGKTLEKLFTASQEAALEQARKELTPLKQGFEESTTRRQVEAIGKSDPWVYTEEGVSTLNQILTEQPYLLHAEDPYKAAYIHYQGQRGVLSNVAKSNSQVLTPTPTAKTSAPVPTVLAANQTTSPTVNLNSKEAIDAHVKTLTPKQQEEFFIKCGYPAFNAR